MAFSGTASAYLHLEQHESDHHSEQHGLDHGHGHFNDMETEHDHHFNLHVIGDLVEHDSISIDSHRNIIFGESNTRLIFRSYIPPIPPPNA
ncbi:MAG: hypothetical protein P1P93_05200 [Gammaproteobacteria bacterium]|nr:hypothetical protein [Gammaproteobacteria bacterium]MDT8372069.1 hypothetical protein [Gammaproteobacteria bacterium]